MTPLDDVPDLDSRIWAKLLEHHITTAEELVGQIEAEPAVVAALLALDSAELQDLKRRAFSVLDAQTIAEMSQQGSDEYGLGALPPDEAPD